VVLSRATRRNVETIRTTEKLIEVIDLAQTEWDNAAAYSSAVAEWLESNKSNSIKLPKPPPPHVNPLMGDQTAHQMILDSISRIPANIIYEVLIALPFLYAERLLRFICSAMESISKMQHGACEEISFFSVEVLCRSVLILVQLHYSMFSSDSQYRDLLSKTRRIIRPLLKREKDQMDFGATALTHLKRQRMLMNNFTTQ